MVTVGAIRSGTVANIVPDRATLLVAPRAFSPQVRQRLLAGVERRVKTEAKAAGAQREPVIKVTSATDVAFNDPDFTRRMGTLGLGMATAP